MTMNKNRSNSNETIERNEFSNDVTSDRSEFQYLKNQGCTVILHSTLQYAAGFSPITAITNHHIFDKILSSLLRTL